MNASQSLQMPYDHYKCLAINNNGLRLLTKMLRKQWEYAFLANITSMFLIFATPHEWNFKFAPNSPKMITLAWRNTEKSEALWMLANFLRISYERYEHYDYLTISFPNLLWILCKCHLPHNLGHGWTRNVYRKREDGVFYTILAALATLPETNVQYSHWNH